MAFGRNTKTDDARAASRAVPASSDTKRSASRKVTKARILPSFATRGKVNPPRLRRERRTLADGRTPFRSLALPRVTRIAPCGVFVTFRDAKRFVFRARTNPKDAAPCRRRGEGRANSVSNEAKLNGRMLPSTAVGGTALQRRSRPFGREFSCFSPKGSAVRTDKQLSQRRKPHFSAAMANQG